MGSTWRRACRGWPSPAASTSRAPCATRFAAGDDLGRKELKNIAKPVHTFRLRLRGAGVAGAAAAAPVAGASESAAAAEPALPDKPSIAVLPFDNMSTDPEQEYFSDGITEDIITALSKLSALFVIARNSAFAYKGKSVNVHDAGRELGVRYVLEGSVRKAANRVRITAQLIDASTGGHLWADRYDRDLEDIFAVQDEVTREIVEALKVRLDEGAGDRDRKPRRDRRAARQAVSRGIPPPALQVRLDEDSNGKLVPTRRSPADRQLSGAIVSRGVV